MQIMEVLENQLEALQNQTFFGIYRSSTDYNVTRVCVSVLEEERAFIELLEDLDETVHLQCGGMRVWSGVTNTGECTLYSREHEDFNYVPYRKTFLFKVRAEPFTFQSSDKGYDLGIDFFIELATTKDKLLTRYIRSMKRVNVHVESVTPLDHVWTENGRSQPMCYLQLGNDSHCELRRIVKDIAGLPPHEFGLDQNQPLLRCAVTYPDEEVETSSTTKFKISGFGFKEGVETNVEGNQGPGTEVRTGEVIIFAQPNHCGRLGDITAPLTQLNFHGTYRGIHVSNVTQGQQHKVEIAPQETQLIRQFYEVEAQFKKLNTEVWNGFVINDGTVTVYAKDLMEWEVLQKDACRNFQIIEASAFEMNERLAQPDVHADIDYLYGIYVKLEVLQDSTLVN